LKFLMMLCLFIWEQGRETRRRLSTLTTHDIYTLSEKPAICPVLVFGKYFMCHPQILNRVQDF
jgi:hypothetical protein